MTDSTPATAAGHLSDHPMMYDAAMREWVCQECEHREPDTAAHPLKVPEGEGFFAPTEPVTTAACSHAGFHEAMSMQCRECGYQPGPATASAFEALLASADPETPNEIDGIDVHHAYEALGMLTCPWRLRTGTCQSGCQTEPACETCEPERGWAQALREAVNGE